MFWTIIGKEIYDGLTSFNFLSAMVALTVLVPLSGYSQATYYRRTIADYEVRQKIHDHENNNRAFVLMRPVPPMLPFYNGVYASLPDEIELRLDSAFRSPSSEDLRPLDWLFPKPYLSLISGVVMTLMTILLSHDSITREREQGTLKLLLSFQVPRRTIFAAKLTGVVLLTMLSLVYAVSFYAVMIIAFSGGTFNLSMTRLIELAVLTLITLLTAIVFAALGITVSTTLRYSSAALIVCVVLWLSTVLIWPSLGAYIASSVRPVASQQTTIRKIMNKETELIQAEQYEHEKTAAELRGQHVSAEAAWQRYVEIKRRWTERKKKEIGQLAADRERQIREQQAVSKLLLSVSPYGALNLSLGQLCGTSVDDYYLFVASAEQYDREKFTPSSFEYLGQETPWNKATEKAHQFQIEPFQMPNPSLARRSGSLALYAGLLILEIAALVIGGVRRFEHYDVC